MLKRLKISRFKSIYEATVDLGRVNLFVGPNGAGKSNILEALGVLSSALSSGVDPVTMNVKGVRLSLPHLFKSSFRRHKLPKAFKLEATFEHGSYSCSITAGKTSENLEFETEVLYDGEKKVFGRSNHGIALHSAKKDIANFDKSLVAKNRSIWNVIEPFAKISPELRLELDQFAKYAIYSPQTAIMRGMAIDNRAVEPLGLTGSGLARALLTLSHEKPQELRDLMSIIWEPGWAKEIHAGPLDSEIVPAHVKSEGAVLYIRDRYMPQGRDMLSTFDASEGTLYLIFVAILLAHPKTPNVFALDNVDGTLNPALVRKLSKFLIDKICAAPSAAGRQAFMTSHHPSSLDSFDIFNPDERIFVCNRSRNDNEAVVGSTLFTPLLPPPGMSKSQWLLAHEGHNLSELMLSDRIPGAL